MECTVGGELTALWEENSLRYCGKGMNRLLVIWPVCRRIVGKKHTT